MRVRRWILPVAAAALAVTLVASASPARGASDPVSIALGGTNPASLSLVVRAGGSGAPSGFVVEWMARSDFDRLGGWPADPGDPALHGCRFTGTPTLNPVANP